MGTKKSGKMIVAFFSKLFLCVVEWKRVNWRELGFFWYCVCIYWDEPDKGPKMENSRSCLDDFIKLLLIIDLTIYSGTTITIRANFLTSMFILWKILLKKSIFLLSILRYPNLIAPIFKERFLFLFKFLSKKSLRVLLKGNKLNI